MKLSIVNIIDRGVANKERLHLAALVPINLAYYAVVASMYARDRKTIAGGNRQMYWFEPSQVNAGDWIILYTGSGQYSKHVRLGGGTNHFFYWGLKETVWHDPLSSATLFEINNWETK